MSFAAVANNPDQAIHPASNLSSKKTWLRSEVEALEAQDAFGGRRIELLEGELIDKMGKLRPHCLILHSMLAALVRIFDLAFVNQEVPIDLRPEDDPTSAPEPDLIVLRRKGLRTTPRPADLRLVVEVSDSTLARDLGLKAKLYGRASIPEYWVVDLNVRQVHVHRDPTPNGYRSVTVHEGEDTISPLEAPDGKLAVASIFENIESE